MRRFTVAGGLLRAPLETGEALLLVCNRRRDGRVDWTPPGGIVDKGETMLVGLSREVTEETSLTVASWSDRAYTVEVEFVGRDLHLTAEVFEATGWDGELHVDDPDGVVVDARFLDLTAAKRHLSSAPLWVREPLSDWLHDPGSADSHYMFRAESIDGDLQVQRLSP